MYVGNTDVSDQSTLTLQITRAYGYIELMKVFHLIFDAQR